MPCFFGAVPNVLTNALMRMLWPLRKKNNKTMFLGTHDPSCTHQTGFVYPIVLNSSST